MNFFENAFEALDGIRHEVIHHAGYAIADLGQALETMRHDVSKCINPLTLKAIEELGKAAGHHASYAAGDIWKILHNAGDNLNTWAKPFIESIEASISGAGQNVHKYFVGAIANGETMDWTSLPAYITSWIEENPERTLGIIFNIIIPVIVGSLAATAVPAILAAFGFTTEGILAGVFSSTSKISWRHSNTTRIHRGKTSFRCRQCCGKHFVFYVDECGRCRRWSSNGTDDCRRAEQRHCWCRRSK